MFDLFGEFVNSIFGLAILVYLIVTVVGLKKRMKIVESKLTGGSYSQPVVTENSTNFRADYKTVNIVEPTAVIADNIAKSVVSPQVSTSAAEDKVAEAIAWLREDWPMKLGGVLILISFGWFVTYAFMNGWIGEVGRIVLGIMAGLAFIVFGFIRIQRYVNQGGVLLVLGSTIVLLTTFAARNMYDMLDPLSSLGIMFLSTTFVAFASVKYRSKALAFCGLILACITPLLTNSPSSDHVGLFTYLLVVILGTVWVVAITGFRELTTAALISVFMYSAPHLAGMTGTADALLLFAFAFSAIFFITNVLAILKSDNKNILADLLTAGGNGIFLLLWINEVVPQEWISLVIVAWMLVFAVTTFSVHRITNRREPFYVYLGIFLAFLAAATAAELEGEALIIAFTIEAALIPIINYAVLKDVAVTLIASSLMLVPGIMALEPLMGDMYADNQYSNLMVILIYGLAMAGLAVFYRMIHIRQGKTESNALIISQASTVVGGIFMLGTIWHFLQIIFEQRTATMLSLVIFTIIAIGLYVFGKNAEMKKIKILGTILLAFVMARLFMIEIWEMDLTGRIITFFSVGILLIASAFMNKKK